MVEEEVSAEEGGAGAGFVWVGGRRGRNRSGGGGWEGWIGRVVGG